MLRALRHSGRSVKEASGIPYPRQILELLWSALRYKLRGKEYFLYGLWRYPQKARRKTFVSHEIHTSRLRRLYSSMGVSPDWCKVKFHDFCKAHDLPSALIISVFQDGRQRTIAGWSLDTSERDVYIKPLLGFEGHNVQQWVFENGSYTRNSTVFSLDEFENHLLERSIETPLILQPRLRNHQDLEHLASGLCTVRLTTSRGRNGRVVCIMPALKIPRRFSEVDNFSANGIAVAVNESTGELGRWFIRRNGTALETTCHPDTGAEIDPLILPYWDEVRRLCTRAQEACKQVHFVGWDVAITAKGPVLLEGNRVFGINLLQVAHRNGLLDTPFPQHFQRHWGR